jgi:hypothetical protein
MKNLREGFISTYPFLHGIISYEFDPKHISCRLIPMIQEVDIRELPNGNYDFADGGVL